MVAVGWWWQEGSLLDPGSWILLDPSWIPDPSWWWWVLAPGVRYGTVLFVHTTLIRGYCTFEYQ